MTSEQQRFLELRSKGKTYDEIAADLGVSRRTLFYWNKELQEEVSFEETAEFETLRRELLGPPEARTCRLAKRLAAIEEEIDKRSLAELSTAKLFSLADSFRRQLIQETTPPKPGRATLFAGRTVSSVVRTSVSRDQNVPLQSDDTESPRQSGVPMYHQLTQLSTPPAPCTDSAIPVQPENTPSPLPQGDFCTARRCGRNLPEKGKGPNGAEGVGTPESLEGMRGPSARSKSSTSDLPPINNLSSEALPALRSFSVGGAKEDQLTGLSTPPAPCTDSAIPVQPASDQDWKTDLASSFDAALNSPGEIAPQCKNDAIPVQPSADAPSPSQPSKGPAPQRPRCQPISPERLIGPNINFREVWLKQRLAASIAANSEPVPRNSGAQT